MSDEVTLLFIDPRQGQLGHALIMEDDDLVANTIEAGLRGLGFSTFQHASSVNEAVAFAKEQRPDLITADIGLASENGLLAIEEICAFEPLPVIIITGDPLSVTLPDVPTLGKPFNSGALRVAVDQARARPFRSSF